MERLRAATGPMHQRLEDTPLSKALMQPELTEATYLTYLEHMRQVIAWTEQHIFPAVSSVMPDIAQRYKLRAIDNDILFLRSRTPAANPSVFPEVSDRVYPLGRALGHMYVMEGATLGGRIILQHIKGTLALDETTGGVAFFTGYGADTGARWRSFLAILTEQAALHGLEDAIVSGAKEAFEHIENYFSGSTICR